MDYDGLPLNTDDGYRFVCERTLRRRAARQAEQNLCTQEYQHVTCGPIYDDGNGEDEYYDAEEDMYYSDDDAGYRIDDDDDIDQDVRNGDNITMDNCDGDDNIINGNDRVSDAGGDDDGGDDGGDVMVMMVMIMVVMMAVMMMAMMMVVMMMAM